MDGCDYKIYGFPTTTFRHISKKENHGNNGCSFSCWVQDY